MRALASCFLALPLLTAAHAADFRYADAAEAGAILTANDGYFDHFSAPETAIKGATASGVSLDALKARYREGVHAFSAEDKAAIDAILKADAATLRKLAAWLPPEVVLVRADEKVEGGLPHTRANAIILSDEVFTAKPDDRRFVFFHELFHVLSRHLPAAKRDELYGLIGFLPCRFEEPAALATIRLTNPDAPVNGHAIRAKIDGKETAVIPFLFSAYPGFDASLKGGMPAHFGFGYLPVAMKDGVCTAAPDAKPANPATVTGIDEQTGGNTGYVIHPEETMADNFSISITATPHDKPVKTPALLDRIRGWFGL